MATNTFLQDRIEQPEIVVGVVSAVGTNLSDVIEQLDTSFKNNGYSVYQVKVSKLIEALAPAFPRVDLNTSSKIDRINRFIDVGNRLRKRLGNDVLAALAIAQINDFRFSDGISEIKFERRVFIVNQLKTEAELNLLREVYGPGFFQVSVYSARDIRVDNLSKQEAHAHLSADKNKFRPDAEAVVNRDEDEKLPHGQKVGKIFQYADLVVNADKVGEWSSPSAQIARFVELLFGANSKSPTRMEYGMYLAHSAALRSLDLSRQVGAAIFRKSGEIASLGSNEVPKATGGTYWSDDEYDAREYRLGRDSNDARKAELLSEVKSVLRPKKKLSRKELRVLGDTQFMDALEYGRIVHAEMSALSDAARVGVPVAGGTIYCTTFPCHMCAKHIVAAGIDKVVFLEPYPKSLASDLHSDSIEIEGMSRGVYGTFPSVKFVPFFGVTPRRYRELFSRSKRKVGSDFVEFSGGRPTPVFSIAQPWYAGRETQVLQSVELALRSIGL